MSRTPARKKSLVKLKKRTTNYSRAFKRALPITLLTTCSVLLLVGLSVYKMISHNVTSALTPTKEIFMESGYPTLLYVEVENLNSTPIQINKIEFKLFDIDGKKLITYPIPLDYEVDMPGRYGLEKISKAFVFGALMHGEATDNSVSEGITTLNSALLTILGTKAERYLIVDKGLSDVTTSFLDSGDFFPLINKEVITTLPISVRSNFSLGELSKISEFIRSLPSDRLITNPHLTNFAQNTEVIDQEIRELMLLSKVSNEGLSVAILNASDRSGLAAFGARIVINNGGRVVAVNNSDNTVTKSVIITDNLDSLSVRRFSSLFGIDSIMTQLEAREHFKDSELDRADIVIVLGFDLAQSL